MTKRIDEWSVGELARKAGVSVRTLHHYDEIGLLRPRRTGQAGYRVYGRPEALRLREIMFYRAMGMGLDQIAGLVDAPGKDRRARLAEQAVRLKAERSRIDDMLAAIVEAVETDRESIMTIDDLYKAFEPAKQAEYEAWLVENYGPDMADHIATSKAQLEKVPEEMAAKMAELRDIEEALVAIFLRGEGDVGPVIERHRAWVAAMWGRPCSHAAHAGLADMYLSHPDFVARFEMLAPRFSQWFPAAIKANAAAQGVG